MYYEELPGLFRIEVPLPGNPLKSLNAYLIRGKERSLLVDNGFNMRESREALFSALGELEAERDRLDLFITHLHSDHNGLSSQVAGRDSRIYCGSVDARKINSFIVDQTLWPRSLKSLGMHGFPADALEELVSAHPGKIYASAEPLSFTCVNEKDVLSYGGYHLRVIATPGHTPGHMCLYEEDRAFLIAGDHILGSITPNITFWAEVEDSLGDYLKSLDKVAALNVAVAYPGHRAVVRDAKARVQALKKHHAARLEEALGIVEQLRAASAWDVAARMRWSLRGNWEAYGVAQKCFAVGEAAAHLDHLAKQKKIQRKTGEDGQIKFLACSAAS